MAKHDTPELPEEPKDRITATVAICVALLATFLGLCSVKDDNIVQAMQKAQADSIDNWAWFQAKRTRIEMNKMEVVQLTAMSDIAEPSKKSAFDKQIKAIQDSIPAKEAEMNDVKKTAEKADKDYDAWNTRDDQFDMADAAISIAIAMFAVTALVKKKWLLALAFVPAIFGVLMGLAGFMGWPIHPSALAKFLGT